MLELQQEIIETSLPPWNLNSSWNVGQQKAKMNKYFYLERSGKRNRKQDKELESNDCGNYFR